MAHDSPRADLQWVDPQCEFRRKAQLTGRELTLLACLQDHLAESSVIYPDTSVDEKRLRSQLIVLMLWWDNHFPDWYLYACPLLGLSGYQWFSYLSHRSFCSVWANSSALDSSTFPHATAIRLMNPTPAFTSLFIVSAELNKNLKKTLSPRPACSRRGYSNLLPLSPPLGTFFFYSENITPWRQNAALRHYFRTWSSVKQIKNRLN